MTACPKRNLYAVVPVIRSGGLLQQYVDAQGNVYFADVATDTVYKLDADGKPQVFLKNSGGISGLMFGPDGRLYGYRYKERSVVAYDTEGKAYLTIGVGCTGGRHRSVAVAEALERDLTRHRAEEALARVSKLLGGRG